MGRWLTLILPMRFEIDEATSMEVAAIMEVTKNNVPRTPSERQNLSLKNPVTQELRDISIESFV
jgi:hypothetical protein